MSTQFETAVQGELERRTEALLLQLLEEMSSGLSSDDVDRVKYLISKGQYRAVADELYEAPHPTFDLV